MDIWLKIQIAATAVIIYQGFRALVNVARHSADHEPIPLLAAYLRHFNKR